VRILGRLAVLRRWPFAVVAAAAPALLLLGSFAVAAVPHDFGVTAAALAALLVVEQVRTRGAGSGLTRTAHYAAAVFIAYLLAFHPGDAAVARVLPLVAMTVLGVAVACYARFSSRQEFGTTPTDFLVLFGVLALIAFGSIAADSRAVVQLVACAAVLLYGFEVVVGRGGGATRLLGGATLAALAILALRGLA
jgi:UDP-GlcNAc:undecaprenyl-phosphate GlcNAc-1-phosphate transferase